MWNKTYPDYYVNRLAKTKAVVDDLRLCKECIKAGVGKSIEYREGTTNSSVIEFFFSIIDATIANSCGESDLNAVIV